MTAVLTVAAVLAYLVAGMTVAAVFARHNPEDEDDLAVLAMVALIWPYVVSGGLLVLAAVMLGAGARRLARAPETWAARRTREQRRRDALAKSIAEIERELGMGEGTR